MQLPALVDLSCKQVTELVSDYLASPGLGTRDRARFEQHLHACTCCMDYLHQLQQIARACRQLRDEPTSSAPEATLLTLFRQSVSLKEAASSTPPSVSPPARPPRASARRRAGRRIAGVQFAFKFLTGSAQSPLSGFRWPTPDGSEPGAWVELDKRIEPCRVGIHACEPSELACWLHEALWLVELGGDVQRSVNGVVATRARLLHEVESYRVEGALRFARAAHEHAQAFTRVETLERREAAAPYVTWAAERLGRGEVALSAYGAAMAVARLRGHTLFDQASYDAERRWQSNYLARDLKLEAVLGRVR